MAKTKIELRLHNFATNEILLMSGENECCQAITDLKLEDHQYHVTEQTFSVEILDFSHILSMWKNKKKAKKPDVEAEPKGAPIEIIGEVIG